MDRRDELAQAQAEEGSKGEESKYKPIYVREGNSEYRLPYDIIRQVVFSNIKKEELIDMPHAARMQYRLMLMDPIIKARVDFTKSKITIIYNPKGADNAKPKMSLDELIAVLEKEGVHVDRSSIDDKDYDYRNFYNYAFNPAEVRERPPYSYSHEEWKKMKVGVEQKRAEVRKKKLEKFHEWQERYAKEHGMAAQ
ncbi:MAG: hypothetical protein M1360_03120 [Candidatus Marsarchaeota archaeon]|jgi:hypothetical protein|nr:hypothetical protein [Candidatus Marsarchaeota archaeon]MCL5418905.1 hypothetical protein [Candidatus Marsarchaeota archaeon]